MSICTGALRVIAVILAVVLAATLAAPAPAHAFDFFNPYVAIASAGLALIILGTYLVIANMQDSRKVATDDQWTSVAVMGPASDASSRWTSLAIMGNAPDANDGWAQPGLEESSSVVEANPARAEQGP